MKRLLVINNYSLERVWREVEQGKKPDHHLFGVNYLQNHGYEVSIVPLERSPFLRGVDRMLSKLRLSPITGCIDQQWSAWRQLDECDLIYSPCQTQTQILSYLRACGWLKVPVVCLAHHPLVRGRFRLLRAPCARLSVRGVDAFPSLARRVSEEINMLAGHQSKSGPLAWGPDLRYYHPSTDVGEGVVAVGRTGRDFDTLGLAASKTACPVRIICPARVAPLRAAEFASNVKIEILGEEEGMSYQQLLPIFASARVLAVPLNPDASLAGLTSLMDALGIGKPVIATRHPLLDLDIEALKIGRWVAPGDIDGWTEAIRWFDANPDEAAQMGRNSRRLAEDGINSRNFADQIIKIFDAVLAGRSEDSDEAFALRKTDGHQPKY